MHEFFHDSTDFCCCLCSPQYAGRRKWSQQFLDYLGEYKILPLFLPSQKLPKLPNIIMDGRKQQGNATIKHNKNKKPPTPMGTCNGRSPHSAHCHMGRVSIQSKENYLDTCIHNCICCCIFSSFSIHFYHRCSCSCRNMCIIIQII